MTLPIFLPPSHKFHITYLSRKS